MLFRVLAALLTIAHGSLPDEAELARIREQALAEKDLEKRITLITSALKSRKSQGDAAELAGYNLLLGDAYCEGKKTKDAGAAYRAALPIVLTHAPRQSVNELNAMARNLYEAGDALESSFILRHAVGIARKERMAVDLAQLQLNLGNLTPMDADAVVLLGRSIEDCRTANRPELVGDANAELAYRAYEASDYQRAITFFERALAIPEWKVEKMRFGAERMILLCSGFSGDRKRAKQYGPGLYETYKKSGELAKAAMVLNDIAYADMEAGHLTEAARGFARSFNEMPQNEQVQKATTKYNEGMALQLGGRWAEAEKAFRQSLQLAKGADEYRAANCNSSLGYVLLKQGKPREALPFLLAAAQVAPDLEDPGLLVVTYEVLEDCYRRLAQTKQARAASKKLDDMLAEMLGNSEVMRLALGGIAGSNPLQSTSFLYSLQVSSALRRGQLATAFVYAERAKARRMVDLDARTPIDPRKIDVNQRGDYAWLRDRVTKLQASTDQSQNKDLGFALNDLDVYEDLLRTILRNRTQGRPAVLQRVVDRSKLDKVDEEIGKLPPDTMTLNVVQTTSVRQDQVAVIAGWSEKGKPRFFSYVLKEKGVPLTRVAVEKMVIDFAKSCASRTAFDRQRGRVVAVEPGGAPVGDRLSAALIDPIRSRLSRFKRIVIAPDECLWRLPVEAIPLGKGKYVVDQWQIEHCYSITQWLQSMRKKTAGGRSLMVFSNPSFGSSSLTPLPGTLQESSQIKRAIPGAMVVTGSKATASRVRSSLKEHSIVHLATHGLFDPVNPMASSLAFSPAPNSRVPSELNAFDITGSVNAKLVVLSACDTGRGEFRPGEGPVGLTYALMRAGCPVVISTRWQVSDEVTAALMGEFYRGLAKGEPIGKSLRLAMLATKRKHPEPYYWAPFMVFGDSNRR